MEKYTQNEEQKYILEYFNNPSDIFFMDIGAFDGKIFSNTYALALSGASGVCVEPSPSVFPYLKALYENNPKIQLFDCAIAEEDGEMDFWDSNGNLLSTLCENETIQWLKDGVKFTQQKVKTISVETLLKQADVKRIDFLSIDAEGYDFQILKQFDLAALQVKMVCIECPHEKRQPVSEYLAERGYRIIYQCSENIITIK